jgi:hypothetical protein
MLQAEHTSHGRFVCVDAIVRSCTACRWANGPLLKQASPGTPRCFARASRAPAAHLPRLQNCALTVRPPSALISAARHVGSGAWSSLGTSDSAVAGTSQAAHGAALRVRVRRLRRRPRTLAQPQTIVWRSVLTSLLPVADLAAHAGNRSAFAGRKTDAWGPICDRHETSGSAAGDDYACF